VGHTRGFIRERECGLWLKRHLLSPSFDCSAFFEIVLSSRHLTKTPWVIGVCQQCQNRWKINLLLSEARAFLAEEDVTSCCQTLIEAMGIIRATSLSAKEDRVLSLLEQCQRLEPGNTQVRRLETLFSSQSA